MQRNRGAPHINVRTRLPQLQTATPLQRPRRFLLDRTSQAMATDEVGGLFGAGADAAANAAAGVAPGAKRKMNQNEQEKRTMLRPWDTAAAQLLNPYGCSDVLAMSLPEIWRAVSEGSAKARFHSELAATEGTGGNYRVGVGLSRFAETLLVAIKQLGENNIGLLLKEEPLRKAMAEADELAPSLKILAVGKGRQAGTDSSGIGFGKLRKEKAKLKDAPGHTPQDVEAATRAVHAWLMKPESPLRGVLSILSSGGAFYSGNVADKVARAWVAQKPAPVEDAVAAALARACGGGPVIQAGIDDDTQGLFNRG